MNAAMSPTAFEKALTVACMRAIGFAPIAIHDCNDALAVAFGATTKAVAEQAKLSVPQTRRRLLGMIVAGTVLRFDREGGSTTWWPVGLAALHKPALVTPAAAAPDGRFYHPQCMHVAEPAHKALTAAVATVRLHWSDVLGVPRDCSTSDARQAFTAALATVPEHDLDAEQQRQRIRDAYNARLTEDGISEYE